MSQDSFKKSRNNESLKSLASEEPRPIQSASSAQEAGDKMRSLETDVFPVAEGEKVVGLLKQKRPDLEAAAFGHDPAQTGIQHHISDEVLYCFEDQSMEEAYQIIASHQLSHLPIVDRSLRIIGVVSRGDVEARLAGHQPVSKSELAPGHLKKSP